VFCFFYLNSKKAVYFPAFLLIFFYFLEFIFKKGDFYCDLVPFKVIRNSMACRQYSGCKDFCGG